MKCAERLKTVRGHFLGKSNLDGLDDIGGSEVVHILYAVRKETATRLGEEECERRESVQRKKCHANLANGPADAESSVKRERKIANARTWNGRGVGSSTSIFRDSPRFFVFRLG